MSNRAPTSSTQRSRAEQLVALPSLSCALSSLPQATSMSNVAIHASTLASRNADSEAKLQKALSVTSRNSQSGSTVHAPTPRRDSSQPTSPNCPSPPLMMRPLKSTKLRS